MALKIALIILTNLAAMGLPAYAGFINGDFQTGDLTGWTTYLTSNGMSGAGNPFVALVDTTGSGTSLAVFFEVGEAVSDGTQQGGGLSQNLFLAAGNYVVTASIATQEHGFGTSWPGTLFSLLVDGVSC